MNLVQISKDSNTYINMDYILIVSGFTDSKEHYVITINGKNTWLVKIHMKLY